MTVKSLYDKSQYALHRSPKQCLEECLARLENAPATDVFHECKKLLVIALDDSDGEYIVSWEQAGMSMSQCVALATVAEQTFLSEMGFNCMAGNEHYDD